MFNLKQGKFYIQTKSFNDSDKLNRLKDQSLVQLVD